MEKIRVRGAQESMYIDPKKFGTTCFHCGKIKTILDCDYANFKVDSKSYPFPFRIIAPSLPVLAKNCFICAKCASARYKVKCTAHGVIHDKYEYGQPPRCGKCEDDLKAILNGNRPDSFKFLVPLTKVTGYENDVTDDIWLGMSKDDYICFFRKHLAFYRKSNEVFFRIQAKGNGNEFELSIFPVAPNKLTSFRILLDNANPTDGAKIVRNGKGNWIEPWKSELREKLKAGIDDKIYLSSFEYVEPSINSLYPSICKTNFVFWTFREHEIKGSGSNRLTKDAEFPPPLDNANPSTDPTHHQIKTLGNACKLPSISRLSSWAVDSLSNALVLEFDQDGVPCILRIAQFQDATPGLASIGDMKLPADKKISFDKMKINELAGVFTLGLNQDGNRKTFIEIEQRAVVATILPERKTIVFDSGYRYGNFFLLIDSLNQNYAVGALASSVFDKKIQPSLTEPVFLIDDSSTSFAVFFEAGDSGNARSFEFYKWGFVFDGTEKISYKDIRKTEQKKIGDDLFCLEIDYETNERGLARIGIAGPDKYIRGMWQHLENKKLESVVPRTDELYNIYNNLKKQNLLIGLLSDIILLDKELEMDISVEALSDILSTTENRAFYENKPLYDNTVKKLLLFSKLLPKIKQNYELLHAFYPHYQLKNELDFVAEAFGPEVAEKIKKVELEKVMNASRQNIGMVQQKTYRIFSEIERSLATFENLSMREEVHKDFLSKMKKYAVHGGQAILIGTLVTTGAAVGGIGLLAGMLGIRAMSDVLDSFHKDLETAILVKVAAEKTFAWWKVFKTILPVTIYEMGSMIDRENERCVARDYQLFQLSNSEKNIATERLKNAIQRKIQQSNSVRFHEVLSGTGILFNEIARDIEQAMKCALPFESDRETDLPNVKALTYGGDKDDG